MSWTLMMKCEHEYIDYLGTPVMITSGRFIEDIKSRDEAMRIAENLMKTELIDVIHDELSYTGYEVIEVNE